MKYSDNFRARLPIHFFSSAVTALIISCMLITGCNAALHAQVLDDARVYAKDQLYLPKIGLDPINGNMFVVFTAKPKDGNGQRILFRQLLVPDPDSLVVDKLTMVTNNGDDAAIAYNHSTKRFLVVWDNLNRGKFEASSIRGRQYSLSGQRLGKEVVYPTGGMINLHPNLVFNPTNQGFLIVWQRWALTVPQKDDAGLFTILADGNGDPETAPLKIADPRYDGNTNLSIYPMSLVFNTSSKNFFLATCETISTGEPNDPRQYWFYILRNDGKYKRRAAFSGVIRKGLSWYGSITDQNKADSAFHYLAWSNNDAGRFRGVRQNGQWLSGATAVSPPDNVDYVAMAYNPVSDQYLMVSESETGLYGTYINANGAQVGNPVQITSSSDADKVAVVWNPVLREFVIVYVIEKSVHDEARVARILDNR